MANLTSRVQALPAELFNRILDYTTLSCEDDEVDLDHGPITRPIGLQINRATRLAAIKEYYGNTAFRFDDDSGICKNWLLSMTVEQRKLLRQVRCLWNDAFLTRYGSALVALKRLHDDLREVSGPNADVVYINVNETGPEEWRNFAELRQMR